MHFVCLNENQGANTHAWLKNRFSLWFGTYVRRYLRPQFRLKFFLVGEGGYKKIRLMKSYEQYKEKELNHSLITPQQGVTHSLQHVLLRQQPPIFLTSFWCQHFVLWLPSNYLPNRVRKF